MENHQVYLTEKEFNRWTVPYPSNMVVVDVPKQGDLTTKSGIKVNFNVDTLYGEGDSSHPADMAEVYGTIVKQCPRLYYNRKDIEHSMSWKTELETQVGDVVFFNHLISKNCVEVFVGAKRYKIVPYEDLMVAKRTWLNDKKKVIDDLIVYGEAVMSHEEVIPLNGFIILREVLKDKLSWLDVSVPEVDKFKGIVAYNGSDNQEYQAKGKADFTGLKEGDLVMISEKAYPFYLERSSYNSHFDGGNQYLTVQKSDIVAVL